MVTWVWRPECGARGLLPAWLLGAGRSGGLTETREACRSKDCGGVDALATDCAQTLQAEGRLLRDVDP